MNTGLAKVFRSNQDLRKICAARERESRRRPSTNLRVDRHSCLSVRPSASADDDPIPAKKRGGRAAFPLARARGVRWSRIAVPGIHTRYPGKCSLRGSPGAKGGQNEILSYKYFLKNWPVYDRSDFAICSGVPVATTCPPASPPSGPRSMMKSAHFTTCMLCSMTTSE